MKNSMDEEGEMIAQYEQLRQVLSADKFCDRLNQPLAYWALPNDRQLPITFLGQPIRDVLQSSFGELAATKGIGKKKLKALLVLLYRITKDEPPKIPVVSEGSFSALTKLGAPTNTGKKSGLPTERGTTAKFNPDFVSEALWGTWRATIRNHGIDCKTLGRLAPSLRTLPVGTWDTPLCNYLDHTLEEIRNLPTHGEKRVHAILEVFFHVNVILENSDSTESIAVLLEPKIIPPLRDWLAKAMHAYEQPQLTDIKKSVAEPLLEQFRIDLGEKTSDLVESRWGIQSASQNIFKLSQARNVSRTRIYQLLENCGKAMMTRWPEGHLLMGNVADWIAKQEGDPRVNKLFRAIYNLCYPKGMRVSLENSVE